MMPSASCVCVCVCVCVGGGGWGVGSMHRAKHICSLMATNYLYNNVLVRRRTASHLFN